MLETKQQKTYFAISMLAVLILGSLTIFQKSNFGYKDNTDYAKLKAQQEAQAKAYADYLASIKTDPVASQKLFQTIITQADIRKEVDLALETNQPINPPLVADKSLNITNAVGQKAVTDYLTEAMGPLVAFNKNTLDTNKQLFTDGSAGDDITKQYQQALNKLLDAPVPREALATQKALVAAYMSYGELLKTSAQFTSGQNAAPWPQTYKQYAEINKSVNDFNDSYSQLINKYKLADQQITFYAEAEQTGKSFTLIPKAQAIFGLGDVTITIGDIPRLIMDAVEEGLVSSFSQFMASFLGKLVQKIEDNYLVANFLYYSDALVSGQYANDYLNKYVNDKLDQQIIRQLIPQFSCNANNKTLKPIFQTKANQYLGFDPQALDPKDPNYYQKLGSVGNFMSSPEGWKVYYEDLAAQTESASQKAIDRELTSSGLKSPRAGLAGGIASSINSIVSTQKAGLQAIMQLGINNAGRFISQFVAQITQTLVTKFVFSGATTSPRGGQGAVGVLKEQSTCLAAAQLTAVVPISGTQYQQPPPAPTPQDLYEQNCEEFPEACNPPPSPTPEVP